MDKTTDNSKDELRDEDISAALASFRKTPAPEADFESRFLADFHQRLAAEESVKQPSLMARFGEFLSSCWRSKIVWGTSFAGICVLCVASLNLIPGADDTVAHSGSEKDMGARSSAAAKGESLYASRNFPVNGGVMASENKAEPDLQQKPGKPASEQDAE